MLTHKNLVSNTLMGVQWLYNCKEGGRSRSWGSSIFPRVWHDGCHEFEVLCKDTKWFLFQNLI